MPVVAEQTEARIEADGVRRARRAGWLAIKIGGHGINARGWPDRLFLWNKIVVWIEFKRAGGELTDNQVRRHNDLRREGFTPVVCWTAEQCMAVLDGHMYAGRNHYPGCEDI